VAELPLLRRFPALALLPRATLGDFPTRVDRITLAGGRTLFLKRDDRSGRAIGGNKVRGLEWLLGGTQPGERIVTVGARGSTHALTTAVLGASLAARVTVVRWNQEMNPAARAVDARIRQSARVLDARFVAAAFAIAWGHRARGARWIPAGGASPAAALGHVNAGLELAEQIAAGEAECPDAVVVPLGTGGTAAGLALGLRLAGLAIPLVCVRVVPRIVGRKSHVLALAERCAALIERTCGTQVARVSPSDVSVEQRFYGGAYGRPLEAATPAGLAGSRRGAWADEDALAPIGIRLDDTYSRKAYAAAVALPAQRPLLWLTFDGRLLHSERSPFPAS
jgi:D-cysteine desulfhydrase